MKKKPVLKRLLPYLRPFLLQLFGALAFALVFVTLTLYIPVLIGQGIDAIVGPGKVYFNLMIPILLRLFVVIVTASLFGWLLSLCTNRIAYYAILKLREDADKKLHSLPLSYLDQVAHGDLVNRIVNDAELVSDGLLQSLTQLFTGIITILGTLLMMWLIHWKIALVVIFLTPLSMFVASMVAKHSAKTFYEQSETQGMLSGYVNEMIQGQKVLKAFGYEERAEAQFEKMNQKLLKLGVKAQFVSSLANPSTRFVNNLIFAAVGISGAIAVINGAFSVGLLSSFLSYATQYTKPFNEVSGVVTQLQSAMASARRIFEFLDTPSESPDPETSVVLSEIKGSVTFENVSFSYTAEKPLIENISLQIKPGMHVAIVGPTGCGKTTLINLLMRFYDLKSGRILIDGQDIAQMRRGDLRKLFGMVLQDTWLSGGTIFENIAYGKPEATLESVTKAAKEAHAHSFIKRLPKGYETVLNSREADLSEGQKQLLSIARVMLLDPPMLILDEATSSIDTRTELKVQKAFDAMMKGRTTFVVAHRLSTILDADMILVMRDGKIIETGSHPELLQKGGFYAELYNSQFEIQNQ